MSEFQYYEFQAVDRPLTKEQMAELRAISSRATISPNQDVNVYNFGGFGGDPAKLMERYFDGYLYLANWGTREIMLRVPRSLLDLETAGRYCPDEWAMARAAGEHVILAYRSEEEDGGGWAEAPEGVLSAILPVRDELAAGDLRALYLGWLLCVEGGYTHETPDDDADPTAYDVTDVDRDEDGDEEDYGELEAGVLEPPVPPGLGRLSPALKAFADFLRIDRDLIAAAAEASSELRDTEPSSDALEQWVAGLPEAEKSELLLRVLAGHGQHLRAELLQRFRRSRLPAGGPEPEPGRRTVGDLRAAAREQREARRRRERERTARERERRAREEAAARAKHLESLVGREEDLWRQAESAINLKQAREYDRAVQLLTDLRDLSARAQQAADFEARLAQLRQRHGTKRTFLERLDRAGLREGIGRT